MRNAGKRLILVAMSLWLAFGTASAQTLVQRWARTWGNGTDAGSVGATAVGVDQSGAVIVTGNSSGNYATIKYSGDGEPVWTNLYNGIAGGDDKPVALVIDSDGSSTITGFSAGSGTGYDFATVRYSSGGNPLWTNRYDGPAHGDDKPVAIGKWNNGDVVIVGRSPGIGTGTDYVLIKYSSSGELLWSTRYNGSENGEDLATAAAVSPNGNIATTGVYQNSSGFTTGVTVSFSPEGVPIWTNKFRRILIDSPIALAVDGSNNTLITGYSYAGGYDCFTIKYSDTGLPLWTNVYGTPSTGAEFGTAITLAPDNTIFVAGYRTNYSDPSGEDYLVLAYSSAGNLLWTNTYSSPGKLSDRAVSAIPSGNNLFVTGYASKTNPAALWSRDTDILSVGISTKGVPFCTRTYSGSVQADDRPAAIAADGTNSIIVAGYTTVFFPSSPGFVTVKYDIVSPPILAIASPRLESLAVLSWDAPLFGLQCGSRPEGPFTNVPSATSPYTNLITPGPQFFRLMAN